jgi:hypothetical protein
LLVVAALPVNFGEITSLRGNYEFENYEFDILRATVIMFTTFFVRFQGTGTSNAPKPPPAPLAPDTAAPVVVTAAAVVAAAVVVGAAAAPLAPVVVAPVVVATAAAVAAPMVVAAAVVVGAAVVVSAAMLGATVAPAGVASKKRNRAHHRKNCPKCGVKAASNRQLVCAGDLCGHVYLLPSTYKKAMFKRVTKPGPKELNVMAIEELTEELDRIFDGTGQLSLSMDMFDSLTLP